MNVDVDGSAGVEPVDAVLAATRALIGLSARSLAALGEDVSTAQYRALVVLASRGPQRMVDLAQALHVSPSTAGRMADRLVARGLVRRHRASGDRRTVVAVISARGRRVLDEVTAARRELISDLLDGMPAEQQRAAALALRALAERAGEPPDNQWPPAPAD